MNESKTPETDAAQNGAYPHHDSGFVYSGFAKELELSRNAWRDCAEKLADALKQCRYRLGEEDAAPSDYHLFDEAIQQFTALTK